MKKRVWKGKRLFSLLLAFVMLASIMPLELLVGAIGTPADSAEDADVSVVMTADQEKCAIGGTANVTLTVTLNNDIDNATIHIALTDQEIEAIQDSFWKTAEEDTGAVLLDESADSAGEVTGTTVTRVGGGLEIQTNEHKWTQTFSVSYPGTAPETLAEGEGAPADESEKFEFSVENDDITLKCFEWVPEDVTSPEPESGTEGPLSDNSTGETDTSADVPVTPADETDTPTDVPETPADETDTSADVLVTPTDETETDVLSDPAEQKNPEDEEPEQPGDAPVEGGAVYETVTLAASTGGEENADGGNDENDGSSEGEGNNPGDNQPKTNFQGVTVTFTNQEDPAELGFSEEDFPKSVTVTEDRTVNDINFAFDVALGWHPSYEEVSTSFRLDLTLPDGMSFPAGAVSEKDGIISIGDTRVLNVTLPKGAKITEDVTYKAEANTLSIPITQSVVPPSEGEETVTRWSYPVTVTGAALTLAPSFAEGKINLELYDTTDSEQGSKLPVSKEIPVNLGETGPVEPGTPTNKKYEQQIIWVDNKDEYSFRPETTGFPEAQLYFTIDDGKRTPP